MEEVLGRDPRDRRRRDVGERKERGERRSEKDGGVRLEIGLVSKRFWENGPPEYSRR